MPLVPMTEFLPKAKANRFAVGQFNMNNLEFAQEIVEAAQEENSPFIYGVSEGALKYMGIEFTVALAKAASEKSGLPIALHLDHGSSFEVAIKDEAAAEGQPEGGMPVLPLKEGEEGEPAELPMVKGEDQPTE